MIRYIDRRKFITLSATYLSSNIGKERTRARRRPRTEWPMERCDAAGTSYRPAPGGPKADPTVRWRRTYDERSAPVCATVSDGRVYSRARNRITVHEAKTGAKRFAFTDGPYVSPVSLAEGPCGREGIATVANEEGLVGLDPRGGVSVFGLFRLFTRRWKFPDGWNVFDNRVGPAQSATPPVVACDRVYFSETRTDSALIALDSSTGRKEWDAQFETDPTRPAVSNDRAFVGVWNHGVVAVDLETGEKRWHRTTDEAEVFGPAVADGIVYVTDERNVYALDAAEGTTIWRQELESAVTTPPVVTDDSVYVATEDSLVSFERSGRRRWRLAGGCQNAAPSVAAETIFQPMRDTLRAVDTAGRVRWTFQADSEVATPTLGDETVYLSSARSLYAIE